MQNFYVIGTSKLNSCFSGVKKKSMKYNNNLKFVFNLIIIYTII